MTIAKITEQMIAYSEGSLHDIAHFIKVHSYARTIALLEGVDDETCETVETAALVHDIACPVLRPRFGGTAPGKGQEREGGHMARALLEKCGVPSPRIDRVVFLVEHHHTYTGVDGMDWQILLEADFLVNAHESGLPRYAVEAFRRNVFRTASGIRLLNEMYLGAGAD